MFIPLWHMIPGNPFVIVNVYSSLTYDSWEPLCYFQCVFLFDIWFLGTPLLSSMFIPLWHMIPGNPLLSSMFIPLWHMIPGNPIVIFNVYSSLTYDSWESLCYLQCLFLFDIWFLGTTLLCSMFIPLWHMIHVNPFVIFNVYFSLTYYSCDPLCYLQCLFLFDIWFLGTPVLSSMFIPLWHMIHVNPFVIFNVYSSLTYDSVNPCVIFNAYSSLTYDSWEPLCYLQCLFLFDIWILGTPLLSSMFIPLWHMNPGNPIVIFNVYSSLTYDSWEPLCYRQCLFLLDIWFMWIPLLSSMCIPLWHMIPGNPFVIFNVYSSLTYDSCEPLCYLQCLFLFDIWFLWTPVLSSMFIPLWHMIPGNPFVIFNVYSFWTYDSCESLCYLQCVFLYDIWFLGTPLLSSIFIPLWHVIPGNPFVIINVYSSLTYDSWESLCYLQCLFLFDIWFLGTTLLCSMFIPLWHMIHVNPFVIFNVYFSLTYYSCDPLCYLQCLFLFDIWFLGTPVLSSMFIPLWHMIHVNPFVIFNVYSSLTYDSCEPLCYLQCLFLFDIWFLGTPLLSSMFIPLWHMIPGNPCVIFNVYSSLTYDSWEPLCYRQCLFLFDIWILGTPLLSSMFIPLWHMIPVNSFVIFIVYSSLKYDSCEPLWYLQCLFLFDIWFLWTPLLYLIFIPLWHMIPGNPCVIFNVYSSLTYDSWEPLCYRQCLFLFDIWFLGTPVLLSMCIPLWHMIPGNPFVIFNVYSSLTYDSWEHLCYLQCLFLFDIWFLGTPLLSSMFIPLWHMIPGNPFVIFNVYSSLTYDSWEPLCYRQCLFLLDIWFLGIPLLSSMFIPLWHMNPGNPFVIFNVYSSLTYDSWEPLCYRQCLFLFDIWFLWTPLLCSIFIPLWHTIPGNPCVIFNVYSSLTYDSCEPLCYLHCLFLFDIWFLGTSLLSSLFHPLWHMIPGNPFVIFIVYSSLTYDSWKPLWYLHCLFLFDIWFLGTPLLSLMFIPLWHMIPWTPFYLQCLFLFDIWFLWTPLLSSKCIPLWHMIPVNPFVIFIVYSSLTYDSCEPLCYLQCLFLFDIWFLRTPLLSSMFIPLWHMIPGNPFVIFNIYSSLTYDSWEPLCYLQCLFFFDIWFMGIPLLSSMFIPLWHMILGKPCFIFNVYSSLTYDSWEALCYLQCLFLFDIWFLGTPLLSSMFIPLWHMIPGNPIVIFNVYSSLTYESWEPLCYLQCLFLFDIWILGTPLLSSMFIPLWHMNPGNPIVIFNVYSSLTYDSWEPLCYRQCLFLLDIWFLGIPLLSSMCIPL